MTPLAFTPIPNLCGLIARRLVLAIFCSYGACLAGGDSCEFALHDGDRVLFYGDSITQDGGYSRFVEAYARSRFPRWDLRFYNAGVGGDSVNGGGAGPISVRLQRDVVARRPTVVTVMLGMNDGHYKKFDAVTQAAFVDGYRAIVARLKESLPGVRMYLIRSSPYDEITRGPDFKEGYNDVLRIMGDAVARIGQDERTNVVNFSVCMEEGIRAVWKEDRALAGQLLPDRVHPSPAGHIVLGATLLRAWRAPSLVARVKIDVAAGKVVAAENAEVSALAIDRDRVTWNELDSCLPLPLSFDDSDTQLAQMARADIESLDSEPLAVTGLQPGRYELRIDDQKIGTFSDAELAGGFNLARYNTPMRWQAYWIRWCTESTLLFQRSRRELLASSSGLSGVPEAAELLQNYDELRQSGCSQKTIPKLRRYSLALVR